MSDPKRQSNGRFGAGNKANPGGRPKEIGHVRELARQHTEDAIRTLVEVMHDPEEKGPARVAAAQALLDRGYGRPPQSLEHSVGGDAQALDLRVRFVKPEAGEAAAEEKPEPEPGA
jgi:hypothetical protein